MTLKPLLAFLSPLLSSLLSALLSRRLSSCLAPRRALRFALRLALGAALGTALGTALGAAEVMAQTPSLIVASTTSTEQSGLFAYLLPRFRATTGIEVRVVAVGTCQALDLGRRGDADVVLVHDRPAEDRFLAEGHALRRYDVMYNDFVLIGPTADPARAGAAGSVVEAFRRIRQAQLPFVSRGDRSGTHAAELRLWELAGIDLQQARGAWYRDTGTGMGPALNIAAAMDAYLLADRGTWIAFRNRQNLRIVLEGDARLRNRYGVMLVNPARHPHVKVAEGQQFIDWLCGAAGQRAIADYRIEGEQLFFPEAAR